MIFVVALLVMLALMYLDHVVRHKRTARGQRVIDPRLSFLWAPLLSWVVVFGGAHLLPHRSAGHACEASLPQSPSDRFHPGLSLPAYTACFNQLADQQGLPYILHPVLRRVADSDASFTALLDDDLQVVGKLSNGHLVQVMVLVSPLPDKQAGATQHAALVDALLADMQGVDEQQVATLVDQLDQEDERDLRDGTALFAQRTDCGFQLSLSIIDGYTQVYAVSSTGADAPRAPASCRRSIG